MGLRVKLTYPQELIKQPVLFKAAMKYKVVPNIRRARVTEDIGELVLELEGNDSDVDKMVKSLKKSGVMVDMLEGDVIE
jgi:ABC-type methionine transport system ATPase subunit